MAVFIVVSTYIAIAPPPAVDPNLLIGWSLVFGALVGFIATYRGYTATPTSAGVSAAATSTVVLASVATLIFDYFITALWGI